MAKGKGRAPRQDAPQEVPPPEDATPQDVPPQGAAQGLSAPTHTMADIELILHYPPRRYTIGEIARSLLYLAQLTEEGLSMFPCVALLRTDLRTVTGIRGSPRGSALRVYTLPAHGDRTYVLLQCDKTSR